MITRNRYEGCDPKIQEALINDLEVKIKNGWVISYEFGTYFIRYENGSGDRVHSVEIEKEPEIIPPKEGQLIAVWDNKDEPKNPKFVKFHSFCDKCVLSSRENTLGTYAYAWEHWRYLTDAEWAILKGNF